MSENKKQRVAFVLEHATNKYWLKSGDGQFLVFPLKKIAETYIFQCLWNLEPRPIVVKVTEDDV